MVKSDFAFILSDIELHEGFMKSVFGSGLADVFETKLIDLINDPSLDLEHIYLTGHSMVSLVPMDMSTCGL